MLGGPCSQHVTGNTSRQNQPQSAIMGDKNVGHILMDLTTSMIHSYAYIICV